MSLSSLTPWVRPISTASCKCSSAFSSRASREKAVFHALFHGRKEGVFRFERDFQHLKFVIYYLHKIIRTPIILMIWCLWLSTVMKPTLFFQLINKLYGQTSIIITSNKKPEDWGDILGDPAITTAILDWLIHKSEVMSYDFCREKMKYNFLITISRVKLA